MAGKWEALPDHNFQLIACLTLLSMFCLIPPWIWVSVRMVDQSLINFSIQDFYLTETESTNGSGFNQSVIFFKLKIANDNEQRGIYYDNLNLTFSYYTSESDIVPVGYYTIPGFRQGIQSETDRRDFVEISKNVSVLSLLPSVSSDIDFRVDLATAVRFRYFIMGFQSKRLQVMAWCKVEVDRITGKKANKKAIRLKHMIKNHLGGWVILVGVILLVLTPLSFCSGYLCVAGCSRSRARRVTHAPLN
ncbi:hypothetical protein DCAR_0209471 [Daucus carota subsp. sativus]|uniref:Uncharacterized protein n=1 Tax=Daucus carota subsp. sativus TaxID=79200 RepID=A0A162AY74_DAUCS|nr:PREDICTED: protein NDR1-like [Daucus carota subsp. sativus]WOG90228.1 hypothetical protein DCAR_0209471 [Daucus carota subsp. sativus]